MDRVSVCCGQGGAYVVGRVSIYVQDSAHPVHNSIKADFSDRRLSEKSASNMLCTWHTVLNINAHPAHSMTRHPVHNRVQRHIFRTAYAHPVHNSIKADSYRRL